MINRVILGDCLEVMTHIPDGSVDAVIADLPYGKTSAPWDKPLAFDRLWEAYRRIVKPDGAIVLFADQPFTSLLVASNLPMFKYTWVWKKSRPIGHTNAKLKPMNAHEDIAVFSRGATANGAKMNMVYNPQGLTRVDRAWKRPRNYFTDAATNPARASHKLERMIEFTGYPRSVLEFENPNDKQRHPTQKPLPLLDYLVRTYTSPGDLVLDNCCGSGSLLIAAKAAGRRFIGIEKDPLFHQGAVEWLADPEPSRKAVNDD